MNQKLVNLLRGNSSRVEQGRVLTADANTVSVTVRGRVKTVRRTNALALKAGDRVNLQGDTVVGRRKPPPTGATYEV